MTPLRAGSAVFDITPRKSLFLCGYPNVERNSTGVHDPLLSSALFMDDGVHPVLFIANDIIFVSKALARRVRARLSETTGVPSGQIMITATHTHSGPLTVERPHRGTGPASPAPDANYMALLEDGIVQAGVEAFRKARPAEAGLALADGSGVGTNRRNPRGPSNLLVPVFSVRDADTHTYLALMTVCCMHPTVLHEESTLITADFPGMARQYLQQQVVGAGCPVLHHTGPAGNQSPRHVTRANTFEEAERLGTLLGRAIEKALGDVTYRRELAVHIAGTNVELPRQIFPSVVVAEDAERTALERLKRMRRDGTPRAETRTAECDWFGAARRTALSRFAASGQMEEALARCQPAEIQIIGVGPWAFAGWPGELFVEFGLAVMREFSDTFVIAYANGETGGYLVTSEAAAEGGYEAAGALFKSPDSGNLLTSRTRELLKSCKE